MPFEIISEKYQKQFNSVVTHPLQSWAWGEFREKLGQKVVRLGQFNPAPRGMQGKSRGKWSHAEEFAGRTSRTDGAKRHLVRGLTDSAQFSAHKIPGVPWAVGYCPRGGMLTREMVEALRAEANKNRCIFVKFEPNVVVSSSRATVGSVAIPGIAASSRLAVGTPRNDILVKFGLRPGKNLFTPYTFQVDLTKSEEELLAGMKPKTRYNIRLAEKKGVVVEEDNSDEAFEEFQKLTEETTKRQRFYAHDRKYRQLMWKTMRGAGIARLLVARLHPSAFVLRPSILTAWVIFIFNGVGYYPYGASSEEHRELMASNLVAWRALQLAKRAGCKKFDFWGSLGPIPDTKDPWYGFHRFKEGYGGELVEFVGTWDLVINPLLYSVYKIVDRVRWWMLKNTVIASD